jgi:ATP-dependent DNA helicase RecQ
MPTGSGKSLCYQLPALLLDGLTVVVSPLIALMQDQVDQLRELGVAAAFLNHTLDYAQYGATAERVRHGRVKLFYVAPETLLKPETLVMLDCARPALFVIDEAHCISSWGHDFRPEYRQLLPVRERYPDAVCAAFTATATPRVQRDIREILDLSDADAFVASFRRENLYLEARPRGNGRAQVLEFLRAHPGGSGIIYCSTRDEVEQLADFLAGEGFAVAPYHAGLDSGTRSRNQRLFQNDEAPIVVATIAFGLGINKPNVRFVVNYTLPENVETYYQEIGRAGRDGLRADCLLLFSAADMGLIRYFIDQGAEGERAGRQARLQAMARYAETGGCRRAELLSYFGEDLTEPRCGFCDNCLAAESPGERVDVTDMARLFLQCVLQTQQRFGRAHIVGVLRGSRAKKVLGLRHDRVPTYGAGRAHSEAAWVALADQLIREGYLLHEMEHSTLRLTEKGRAVLSGEPVWVAASPSRAAEPAERAEYDAALFEQLRSLRRELARAADLPPYVIFSDVTLTEMAAFLPHSPQSLLMLRGVGMRKLDQYGDRFLALIRGYCAEHGLAEKPRPPEARPRSHERTRSGGRSQEVGELFAAGSTVEDLCARYGVVRNTIVNHLIRYVQNGGRLDAGRVLALSRLQPDEQARALAAFAACGPERLTPVYEALGRAIPYDELHLLRLYLRCRPAGTEPILP